MDAAHRLEQEEVLRKIVIRLTSQFAPRRILLYGSRATGAARADSDHDLLIVWRDENPPAARAATIRQTLRDLRHRSILQLLLPSNAKDFAIGEFTSYL